MNQSLKSWSIHHGIDHYSEKKWGQKNFRGQIWGQANFWGQAKIGVEAKIEAKIEARPTLGPGQAKGARPGFIVCRIEVQSLWTMAYVVDRCAIDRKWESSNVILQLLNFVAKFV